MPSQLRIGGDNFHSSHEFELFNTQLLPMISGTMRRLSER